MTVQLKLDFRKILIEYGLKIDFQISTNVPTPIAAERMLYVLTHQDLLNVLVLGVLSRIQIRSPNVSK